MENNKEFKDLFNTLDKLLRRITNIPKQVSVMGLLEKSIQSSKDAALFETIREFRNTINGHGVGVEPIAPKEYLSCLQKWITYAENNKSHVKKCLWDWYNKEQSEKFKKKNNYKSNYGKNGGNYKDSSKSYSKPQPSHMTSATRIMNYGKILNSNDPKIKQLLAWFTNQNQEKYDINDICRILQEDYDFNLAFTISFINGTPSPAKKLAACQLAELSNQEFKQLLSQMSNNYSSNLNDYYYEDDDDWDDEDYEEDVYEEDFTDDWEDDVDADDLMDKIYDYYKSMKSKDNFNIERTVQNAVEKIVLKNRSASFNVKKITVAKTVCDFLEEANDAHRDNYHSTKLVCSLDNYKRIKYEILNAKNMRELEQLCDKYLPYSLGLLNKYS